MSQVSLSGLGLFYISSLERSNAAQKGVGDQYAIVDSNSQKLHTQ